MNVPFVDLIAQHRTIEGEIKEAVEAVLDTAAFALGPAVEDFEENFARFCRVNHCAGVSSGTSALHLALSALDVGQDDEVITSPATFVATAWAITYVGATPVFVDVDPDTWTLDPEQLEEAIRERTKAIVPVHLYGQPAKMDPILEIAREHDLAVVEDAAQAQGASYRGRRCGSLGDLACFSFYPSKNLGAYGEAGAVVTGKAELDARIRRLRDHGQKTKYVHEEVGFNYRMDGVQGAVLSVKLQHLDRWNQARREIAEGYRSGLSEIDDLTLPIEREGSEHVYHIYSVLARDEDQRDELRAHLDGSGIATGLHYPIPVHLQPAYRHLGHEPGDFPVAERLATTQLSLPMYPEMTARQVTAVIEGVRGFFCSTD